MKKEIQKVKIRDISDYDPENCCNGGKYSFSTTYCRIDGTEAWEVYYGTSADFKYCEYCGSFYYCDDCSCGMEVPDVVNTTEVLHEVLKAQNSIEYEIEWEQ